MARVAALAHIRGFIAGASEHRPAVGERRLGEDVVGEPVGELRERVRGAGRDDEQVGAGQVLVEVLAGRPPRERLEGLGADEPLGAGRDERDHLVAAAGRAGASARRPCRRRCRR